MVCLAHDRTHEEATRLPIGSLHDTSWSDVTEEMFGGHTVAVDCIANIWVQEGWTPETAVSDTAASVGS